MRGKYVWEDIQTETPLDEGGTHPKRLAESNDGFWRRFACHQIESLPDNVRLAHRFVALHFRFA